MAEPLALALHANAPRWTRPPTPFASLAIHGVVLLVWVILFGNAFFGFGLFPWSIGISYIGYDTFLLVFVAWQTRHLRRPPPPVVSSQHPALAVIVAAYNEAAVLEATIAALMNQSTPPDEIIIADDGSTDGTAALLQSRYRLTPPPLGALSGASAAIPALRWLRAAHAGKASVLNQALLHVESELVLTVDADTLLEFTALSAMRDAFAANPRLVAATGVLTPACGPGLGGRLFEWFQTYEYVRNFLSRYAWMQVGGLLLISGAFAGFRRAAILTVGGFDDDCMVEDYELIHRLRRYGYDHGLGWESAVLGAARARTCAPATMLGFLRQRRRWFGGFLQTQLWYRDMVGNPHYARLGTMMLPVKAVDTMQPIYGLCAFALLLWYVARGDLSLLAPVGGLILAKIIIDLTFHGWSIFLYRNWVGGQTKVSLGFAILAAIAEPFSFQLLRHLGASWGWWFFLTGQRQWGTQKRT